MSNGYFNIEMFNFLTRQNIITTEVLDIQLNVEYIDYANNSESITAEMEELLKATNIVTNGQTAIGYYLPYCSKYLKGKENCDIECPEHSDTGYCMRTNTRQAGAIANTIGSLNKDIKYVMVTRLKANLEEFLYMTKHT